MSNQMYSVFPSRAAGRVLTSVILLSAVPLLGACSSGMERFNYPAFGLSDSGSTASLPVPREPMYGNARRSSAPAPDYNNRPVPLNNDRFSNQGRYNTQQPNAYQRPNANSQGYGAQRPYGASQGYGTNQRSGNNTAYNNSYNNGTNNGSVNGAYGQQNSVKIARLPEPNRSRGPLPTAGSIPQVTYSQPEPARAAPQARNNSAGKIIEVAQGQTLYGIARAYGVSVQDIKTVNNLQGNSVRLGQKLIIPGNGARQQAAYVAPSQKPARNNVRSVRTEPVVRNRNTGRTYRVSRGDSLYGIARRHGMTTSELARYNGISQSTALTPGQTLSVPKDSRAAAPAKRSAPRQVARLPEQPPAAKRLPRPASRAVTKFRWPVEGRIISRFGSKNNGTHNDGVNLAVPAGTSVRAAENGVVAYSGNELKGYGNLILVRHADNWVSAYAHVDKILVSRGDNISRGQVIAKSGKTGGVERPQVHFELRKNSKPVNPLTHLASR